MCLHVFLIGFRRFQSVMRGNSLSCIRFEYLIINRQEGALLVKYTGGLDQCPDSQKSSVSACDFKTERPCINALSGSPPISCRLVVRSYQADGRASEEPLPARHPLRSHSSSQPPIGRTPAPQ